MQDEVHKQCGLNPSNHLYCFLVFPHYVYLMLNWKWAEQLEDRCNINYSLWGTQLS